MSFSAYSAPHPQTRFSAEFFQHITLADASHLVTNNFLPSILPKDTVKKWLFTPAIPTTISEIIVASDEEIPCLDDRLPITQAVEKAYVAEGARSICLQIGEKIVRYHLSKIRLIVGVNNHIYNLHAASMLLARVESSSLLLPDLIQDLKLNHFSEPLAGFLVTQTPIYSLGCLLDERWAMEDVLNARAELIYFRRAADNLGEEPSFAFLPTAFINDCRKLVAQPHRVYSPQLVRLRGHIRSGTVKMLGFLSWTSSHYAAVYKFAMADLENGDSLHLPAARDILPILRWAFAGLGDFAPPAEQAYIRPGLIARQSALAGSGSCGIAAMNFVETRVGLSTPRWLAAKSTEFRDPFKDWVQPCTNGEVSGFTAPDIAIGYRDFNLYQLSMNFEHPIFEFEAVIHDQPKIELTILPVQHPRSKNRLEATPTVPTAPTVGVSSLDALKGSAPPVPPISQLSALTLHPSAFNKKREQHKAGATIAVGVHVAAKSNESFEFGAAAATNKSNSPLTVSAIIDVSDTPPSTPKAPTAIIVDDSPGGPAPVTPKTPPRRIKDEVVNLCSPEVVDLRTPPRLATKQDINELNLSPFRPSIKRKGAPLKVEPFVIDLVSPPRTKAKIEPIATSLGAAQSKQERDVVLAFGPIKVGNIYDSLEAGVKAVYTAQEALGHKWIFGQSTKDDSGALKKRMLRCNRYRTPVETHLADIDPSDYRRGKSGRTNCDAHINLVRVGGANGPWRISLVDAGHNHAPHVPLDGRVQRPPTTEQRAVVDRFADTFSRTQLKAVLQSQFPDDNLEPRQITNMRNQARREAHEEINALGGDFAAILASLEQRNGTEPGWNYSVQLDTQNVLVTIWWQSPAQEDFDAKWDILVGKYPAARSYLQELYLVRDRWAWAWISVLFTAGIRTNGRVEVENRITKAISGPKKTLFQVLNVLNERTLEQQVDEHIRVRDASRKQHPTQLDSLFKPILDLLRKYAGPFALNTCYKQMSLCMFYSASALQLPDGIRNWSDYAIALGDSELGYEWENNEEQSSRNNFSNDGAYIGTRFLLRLVREQGLVPSHLIKITHTETGATHIIALLPDCRYLCDCCMGINLGVVCRHFFIAWVKIPGLPFHISLIRARWYQDPTLQVATTPSVTLRQQTSHTIQFSAIDLPGPLISNPLSTRGPPAMGNNITATPPPVTQTINQRRHEDINGRDPDSRAARRSAQQIGTSLIHYPHIDSMEASEIEADEDRIHDPPTIHRKGRPLTQRLTGPSEGRPRGGGGSGSSQAAAAPIDQSQGRRQNRCGICHQTGHNRTSCPWDKAV
ncbi:hypothetical protein B0H17DRAFT_1142782 [Mycena rosella]|uniref:SWIM-type domain-containing protein n=1 Tax=Mycena rosella TaxID=1033263 RepID=A0AAD7CX30_MYCRO|nr:hypothetical protein B0H17DRAFT_1142782 [Mycena rosella]